MLIAQITDIHLGFDPVNPDEFNRQRLDVTLAALRNMSPQPDLLLVTGDIANDGDDATSYHRYREAIAGLPFPIFHLMGNHDSRGPFLELFPEVSNVEGFIQYAIEDY
ncbi:MAG: metallophosphoesterase, partial [Allosphingosinicella sp.]